MHNPNPARLSRSARVDGRARCLAVAQYLPFWNTVILLSSSVTVHFAHTGGEGTTIAARLKFWLAVTVLLGVLFLYCRATSTHHAYTELGLTLGSGIYGSTFFILTGLPRFPRDARQRSFC